MADDDFGLVWINSFVAMVAFEPAIGIEDDIGVHGLVLSSWLRALSQEL
jgi:hypothetical protein